MMLVSCAPKGEYRNIAHFRAAYQSSQADYDHAVQLVTDGIIEDEMPRMCTACVNGEVLAKHDREWMVDWAPWSTVTFDTCRVDYVYVAGAAPVVLDNVHYIAQAVWNDTGTGHDYCIELMVSEDGENWEAVGSRKGSFRNGGQRGDMLEFDIPFGESRTAKAVRILSDLPDAKAVKCCSFIMSDKGVDLFPMEDEPFHSTWVSDGAEGEWIYVDLGARSSFDKLVFFWLNRPLSGRLLVSDDAKSWKDVCGIAGEDTLALGRQVRGRYVKVEMDATADGKPFVLSELEVWGRNGLKAAASDWKVCRESEIDDPDAWLPAVVPGTVLWSYQEAGAVPDLRYSDNVHDISNSYFRSNFVYRGVMTAPDKLGDKVWLNFDGINWKADVRLNGVELGHIAGAFTDARFDVTDIVRPGSNEVEARIHIQDHPGVGRSNTMKRNAINGGVLGADNPTFHASIGWDWIPSVPGREIGIWNDLYFSTTGVVTIEDPFVRSTLNLPDTTRAEVSLQALLRNNGAEAVDVILRTTVKHDGEGPESETTLRLEAGESRLVALEHEVDNPALWWPNGYGEQNLYDVRLEAEVAGAVSDSREFKAGIRQFTYDTSDGRLTAFCNGHRVTGKGGNWGFSEVNLRFRAKEYDDAVRYHARQNFTMIRNWVGQTPDDEFYQACDKYGIMVWQDFWLANPGDGPNPSDEEMFMANAVNLVHRIRNHASVALYCGRNEGFPPENIDKGLARLVAEETDLFYIPHSSRQLVSGEGPYWRLTAEEIFALRGNDRIHSERGMPNVQNYESLVNWVPEEARWPQNQIWAEHDWTRESAQHSEVFNEAVRTMFGEPQSARQFCEWAQWVNYDGYRAMFEGRSLNRRGLLLWMSHSCWPSMVWSTYDYYFDPTGSFFGARKGCEPLHVQWNALSRKVEVVNVTGKDHMGLQAQAQVLDMYGSVKYERHENLDSFEDTTVEAFGLDAPDDCPVYFYRLRLMAGDELVSENTYVLGAETDNFRALRELPEATVKISSELRQTADGHLLTCTLKNTSPTPALMLHLQPRAAGKRVLPYCASDNYFHLMPGETKVVTVEMDKEDCHGARPAITVSGFNLAGELR